LLIVILQLVNQTLSQSAPASVILAVKSVAKIFAGEIIEGARKVQSQWLEVSDESQTGLPSPPSESQNEKEDEEQKQKKKETRRGPLMPDHLRESIRRYKIAGEGCLAGQLGLWQQQQLNGVERFGSKVMGKRLMK
jgi:transcription initiation factor TFIID subunit 11